MRKDSLLYGSSVAAVAAVLTGWMLGSTPAWADADHRAQFEAVATAAFHEADADGSGELSAAEFVNFHEILRSKLEALRFSRLDTDGSGGISQAELEAGRPGPGHRFHGPGF